MLGDVLLDRRLGGGVDVPRTLRERGDKRVRHAGDLPGRVAVAAPGSAFPTDAERSGEVVAEDRLVQFGHGDGPVVQRGAVEGAPLAIAHRLDLVGYDDVGMQVRVVGTGVVVVERGSKDASGVELHDRSTRSLGAGAGGDDLALDEIKCLLDGAVVRVGDDRLRPRVGDRPQDAGRLRDRERHVEPGDRVPALARLGLGVGTESGAELLALDRVLAVPDKSPEVLLGNLVADLEVTIEAGDAGAEPIAGRAALLGVIARQRVSQGPVPVARGHSAQ